MTRWLFSGKRVSVALVVAAALVATVVHAQDWEEQVAEQIEAIHDEIASDFDYASDMLIGETEAGEATTFTLTVHDGAQYIIVAVCDFDCSDVDLAIYDPENEEVAADIELDDYPVLDFQGEGDYEVAVIMSDCAAETCAWAAQVFVYEE